MDLPKSKQQLVEEVIDKQQRLGISWAELGRRSGYSPASLRTGYMRRSMSYDRAVRLLETMRQYVKDQQEVMR